MKNGIAIHLYSANTSMKNLVFYNSDGDYLIGNNNNYNNSPIWGYIIYNNWIGPNGS